MISVLWLLACFDASAACPCNKWGTYIRYFPASFLNMFEFPRGLLYLSRKDPGQCCHYVYSYSYYVYSVVIIVYYVSFSITQLLKRFKLNLRKYSTIPVVINALSSSWAHNNLKRRIVFIPQNNISICRFLLLFEYIKLISKKITYIATKSKTFLFSVTNWSFELINKFDSCSIQFVCVVIVFLSLFRSHFVYRLFSRFVIFFNYQTIYTCNLILFLFNSESIFCAAIIFVFECI